MKTILTRPGQKQSILFDKTFNLEESFKLKNVEYQTRQNLNRWLSRFIKAKISPSQFSVLSDIFSRTIDCGKWYEIITVAQMSKGLYSKKYGRYVSNCTGLSAPTVIGAVKALLDLGLISRWEYYPDKPTKYNQPTFCYRINFKWQYDTLLEEIAVHGEELEDAEHEIQVQPELSYTDIENGAKPTFRPKGSLSYNKTNNINSSSNINTRDLSSVRATHNPLTGIDKLEQVETQQIGFSILSPVDKKTPPAAAPQELVKINATEELKRKYNSLAVLKEPKKSSKEIKPAMTLEAAIAFSQEKTKQNTLSKLDLALSTLRPNSDQFELVWNEALAEYHPGASSKKFSIKEKAIVKNKFKALIDSKFFGIQGRAMTQESPLKFVQWVLRNWNALMSHKFAWLKEKPEYPTLGLFIAPFFFDGVLHEYTYSKNEAFASGNIAAKTYRKLKLTGLQGKELDLAVEQELKDISAKAEYDKAKAEHEQATKELNKLRAEIQSSSKKLEQEHRLASLKASAERLELLKSNLASTPNGYAKVKTWEELEQERNDGN